jgi:hypothetical protein
MSVADDGMQGAGGRRFRRILSEGVPLMLAVFGMLVFVLGIGSEDSPSLRSLRGWGPAMMGAGVASYLAQGLIALLNRRK